MNLPIIFGHQIEEIFFPDRLMHSQPKIVGACRTYGQKNVKGGGGGDYEYYSQTFFFSNSIFVCFFFEACIRMYFFFGPAGPNSFVFFFRTCGAKFVCIFFCVCVGEGTCAWRNSFPLKCGSDLKSIWGASVEIDQNRPKPTKLGRAPKIVSKIYHHHTPSPPTTWSKSMEGRRGAGKCTQL